MPRASNRLRRYVSVCRGAAWDIESWSAKVIRSLNETGLPQGLAGNAATAQALPDILGQQIRFQVYFRTRLFETQCGVGQGVRDEGHAEAVRGYIHQREADAVHGHRALGHHLRPKLRRAGEPDQLPLAFLLPAGNLADAVNMSLHEVTAQSIADAHGSLHVDAILGVKAAEIRPRQRLRSRLEAALAFVVLGHGEAGAVESHTFAGRQLAGEGHVDGQPLAGTVCVDAPNGAKGFDEACKHGYA